MNIRTAKSEDAESIAVLINDLILELGGSALDSSRAADACRRVIGNPPDGLILLAEKDGNTVGICTLSFQDVIRTLGRYAIIQEMYVMTEYRGRGLGAEIVERAIAEAQARGCKVVELGTPPDGERQERFYQSLGFRPVGMRLRWTTTP